MSSSGGRQWGGPAWGGCTKPCRKLPKARWNEIQGAMRQLLTIWIIWRNVMWKPHTTASFNSSLNGAVEGCRSFVTLAWMNLNNLYSFIYFEGDAHPFDPLMNNEQSQFLGLNLQNSLLSQFQDFFPLVKDFFTLIQSLITPLWINILHVGGVKWRCGWERQLGSLP